MGDKGGRKMKGDRVGGERGREREEEETDGQTQQYICIRMRSMQHSGLETS